MKIFISYGHNDHAALVDAVYNALRAAGHAPWKDDRYDEYHANENAEESFRSGISAGSDFNQVIYDAILDSDFVIAFVTHKTLASRYCRDERQYAYDRKGNRFIQLRLDGIDMRLGNSGSYVDMSGVEDRDGSIQQALLDAKMQAIYAALRSPESLLSPNAKFERYLRIRGTMPYEEFITMPAQDDFVGRQWLMQKCRDWVLNDSYDNRIFVLLGEAGTGKTAFVRHLSGDQTLVRSVHVCVFDRPKTRNIKDTLKNLAYILTQTNPRYSDFLRNRSFDQLDDLDYDGLFEFLFVEPLKNEQDRYLLIIDGLDELEDANGLIPLIKVLRQYATELSPRVSILITTRPEEYILSKLRTINPGIAAQSIQLNKDNGREDLQEFIRRNLTALDCYSDELQQRIFDACDGNFEYLTLLFKEAAEEDLHLTSLTTLPRGLQERYTQYLDRRMEKNGQDESLTRMQHTLLSVLSVAYEPLPVSLLCAITGYDEYDVQQELKVFGSLIRHTPLPGHDQLISFFSKGFRDYLLAGHSQYYVNAALGTRSIATYLMKACRTEAALQDIPYLDKHGFVHLLLCLRKDQEGVTEYINCMIQADEGKTAIRIARALCKEETDTIHAFMDAFCSADVKRIVLVRLHGYRARQPMLSIAAWYESHGYPAYACNLEADVLLMDPSPQVLLKVEALYHRALEIQKQIYAEHPDYQSRYDLSICYGRLGDIFLQRNTPESLAEAESWYKKQLPLDELNAREHPGSKSRRDLSICYGRLGYAAQDKGTPEGRAEAESWFRKQLALYEANLQENPGYQSKYDLSLSYERLGDLALEKNTPEGVAEAESWFRKKLAMAESCMQENPGYQSRRNLSLTYERLGELALQKNTPEGLTEAESWFQRQLAMDKINAQENPSYQSRGDLISSYSRLTIIAHQRQNIPAAIMWLKAALPLAEENVRQNPCEESEATLNAIREYLKDLQANA